MKKEEKKLYDEWKDFEDKIRSCVIYSSDVQKLKKLQLRVWDELRDQLPVGERYNLGFDLKKSIKEIYNIKPYPPKIWPLAKQWGTKAIHRASGGFNFILRCLERIHQGGTDVAYSRSVYMLLSFHCELLLKAYLLLLLKDKHGRRTKAELNNLLKGKNGHDLKELSDKIGKDDLLKLGINKIDCYETNNDLKRYEITLKNKKKIKIDDLVTVRYDFMDEKLRSVNPKESKKMKCEVKIFLDMTSKVMKMIPNST
ncbi:hypothetical protein ACFLZ0_00080 [Patescibacteria group bacterium]